MFTVFRQIGDEAVAEETNDMEQDGSDQQVTSAHVLLEFRHAFAIGL